MKSHDELKDLHGDAYVEQFKRLLPKRLKGLVRYMNLKRDYDVADFACGNGMLMESVAPIVNSYVGIDFSPPFIKAANEKKEQLSIKNAQFVCSDINEFCQRNQKCFDVGFAMDFSEHVYDQEWRKLLENIRCSIKPGGKLYLHTPNADFFLEKMKSSNFIIKQFPVHIAVRTPEYNALILREAGFRLTHVRLIPHYNFLKFFHPMSHIPILGKYFNARIFIEATA